MGHLVEAFIRESVSTFSKGREGLRKLSNFNR